MGECRCIRSWAPSEVTWQGIFTLALPSSISLSVVAMVAWAVELAAAPQSTYSSIRQAVQLKVSQAAGKPIVPAAVLSEPG